MCAMKFWCCCNSSEEEIWKWNSFRFGIYTFPYIKKVILEGCKKNWLYSTFLYRVLHTGINVFFFILRSCLFTKSCEWSDESSLSFNFDGTLCQ